MGLATKPNAMNLCHGNNVLMQPKCCVRTSIESVNGLNI